MIEYKLYDEKDPKSIENYAQKLINKTFEDVINIASQQSVTLLREKADYGTSHENTNRKGGLGEIIEECFFHYKANNDSNPDFKEAGCELKVTPYKQNKNGTFSAKERLVITMINYMEVVNESFETSHFWNKSKLILLVYYLWLPNIDRLKYKINYAKLFSPPAKDLVIIKQDFEKINNKIKAGLAHELSGSDTLYLEACTKSSKSTDRTSQPYSNEKAKPRAFAFKSSYMTYILNNYIIPGKTTYESILSDISTVSFEDYVIKQISKYKDCTQSELCKYFDISFDKKPKNLGAMLAYRMLGIKGNKAEEFEKSGIVIKTIRIEKNNKIKENMSFPTFKFKDLIKETWENSTFHNYLSDTRFFFVVFKYDENDELRFKGCQFWNIPYDDLNGNVKNVWLETVRVLKEGLIVKKVNGRLTNNFPKASNNPICHVRPHAQNRNDVYELPDGRTYPKQCFWLNNSYILSQLDISLKN